MKKREVLNQLVDKVGQDYFMLIQFASLVGTCREAVTLSKRVNEILDCLMRELGIDAEKILVQEVEEKDGA